MRRLSLVVALLCAVAFYVEAHPYSKIPDSIQLANAFASSKASLSANSNIYSQANHDDIAIEGSQNGQTFAGSKTSSYSNNGGAHSHSFSSSSVKGALPIGLVGNSATSNSQIAYGTINPGASGFVQTAQHGSVGGSSGYDANAQDSSSGQFQGYAGSTSGQSGSHHQASGHLGHVGGQVGQTEGQIVHTGGQHGTVQYWWNGPNSPFDVNGKPLAGCTQNGCLASATYDSSVHKGEGGIYAGNDAGHVEIKVATNPFFQTSGSSGLSTIGSSVSSSSGHKTRIDVAKNPFLNGVGIVPASVSGGYGGSSGSSSGSSSSSFSSSSSSGSATGHGGHNNGGSKNPFLSNTGSSSATYGSTIDTQANSIGAGKPFYNSVSGSGTVFGQQIPSISGGSGNIFNRPQVPQIPQIPQFGQFPQIPQIPQIPEIPQIPGFSQGQQNNYDQQVEGFPSYPSGGQKTGQESIDGGFQVSCTGEGNICVPHHLCSAEGYVFNKGLTQVRSEPQLCNTKTEVCCTLKSHDQSSTGSYGGHSTISSSFGTGHEQKGQKGGIFGTGNTNQEQPDLSTGEAGNQSEKGVFGHSNSGQDNSGYLPPLGSEPSSNVPSFSQPPAGEEPDRSGGSSDSVPTNIFPAAPAPPPQVGCAAALLCVEEQFCTLEGVISPSPVALSSAQLIRRVPLSSCKNPDNGVIGKCCRDPNYVDPWPAGNLPANYSGGFDEQGFPTFLNIAKTRPPKKQQPTGGPVNGGRPPTKNVFPGSRPQVFPPQRQPPFPHFPSVPPQISNIPSHISNTFHRPTQTPPPFEQITNSPAPFPQLPTGNPTTPGSGPSGFPSRPTFSNLPNFPNLPTFPTIPNPFIKNNFDTSSSNQNPTIIAPHVPGSHCGLRNKVQRPNGLTDVDVAFGEIPWQAMVLSNREKKLLCSGVIVAPNAVVTAASCVDGFAPSEVSIKAGEWKLGYDLKHEEPLPFEILNVVSIASYPGYHSGNPANDIAILFLERNVALDQHVDTLCLPVGQPRPPLPGRKCIATGWGKTILQVNVAGSLMHSIDVDVLDHQVCQQRLSGAESQIGLDESLVCTKAHKQNNNMCQVDLGGPLACETGDGYYELSGIYNQDTGCLPTNQVATFAKIPIEWITNTLAKPPTYYPGESQSPSNLGPKHTHGPDEPCDCQKSDLPSGNNQYLPPQ